MLNKKQSIKQEQYGQCVFFFSDETGACFILTMWNVNKDFKRVERLSRRVLF